jgi:hypothetical protein
MQNQLCTRARAKKLQNVTLCPLGLLRITLDPVFCVLLKLLAVLAILVGDGGLDSVVRVWLDQERLDEAQHGHNLVWRLPFVGTEQAQTHGTLVVVAHVGVVDLGPEADDRGLERIFVREGNLELEVTALRNVSSRWAVRHFWQQCSRRIPNSDVQRRWTDLARP